MMGIRLALVFSCLLALLAGLCPLPSVAQDALRDYWSLGQYLSDHPEQVPLSDAFAKRVHLPAEPRPLHQTRPVKIAIITPGDQVSDYWRRNQVALEARLKELGIRYQLEQHATRPEEDPRHQSQYLQQALQSHPDYLIFTLDTLHNRKVIERIISRGTPKLILQNITTPLRALQDKQPFLYVGFDHIVGTGLLANYFGGQARGPTPFGVIYRAPGYVSTARGDTFIESMKEYEAMQFRTAYYTESDRRSAEQAALAALDAFPDLKLLYACATDTAMGILDALKQRHKLGQVKVNGWGGGSAELAALARGELDVTVMRMNDDTGVAIAEAIGQDLQGHPVPTVYSGEFALVSQGMAPAKLEELKARAFRYSGVE